MPKGDDIMERLLSLAVSVAQIFRDMAKKECPNHISNQLLRSGTSPAANYAEARSAESRKDFIHKLGIVLKELNECLVWIQLLRRLQYVDKDTPEPLQAECAELCRIIAASIKTVSTRNG